MVIISDVFLNNFCHFFEKENWENSEKCCFPSEIWIILLNFEIKNHQILYIKKLEKKRILVTINNYKARGIRDVWQKMTHAMTPMTPTCNKNNVLFSWLPCFFKNGYMEILFLKSWQISWVCFSHKTSFAKVKIRSKRVYVLIFLEIWIYLLALAYSQGKEGYCV
jgi:hypothetical protein